MKKVIAIILLTILSISCFALRIESGDTTAKGTFFAALSSDYATPSTGLSDANFTRWYYIDGTYGSAAYVTITEVNAVNMPGLYEVTFADPNIITLTDCNEAELTLRFYPNDGITAVSLLAAEVFRDYRLSMLQADVNGLNTIIAREIESYAPAKAGDAMKLAADGLDALDVNEPASTDPNTWSFKHALLWPFWQGTNIYKMEVPDLNYPGIGALTLYKRDGVTVFTIQDINETNNVQIRRSIWD